MKIHRYPRDRRAIADLFTAPDATRDAAAEATVDAILADVRARGDAALADLSERHDGRRISAAQLPVGAAACARAWDALSPDLQAAIETAHANIRAFHQPQLRTGYRITPHPGLTLEQRLRPLGRIGAYVPGGRAPLPSSLLMNVIPAQIAGVPEIVICTPPLKTSPEESTILAVAHALGVGDSVYQVGGAQAIAALAYGTKTIPKVDKVVGPGNRYVALAKRRLYGTIDIDSIAGNSEVMILADPTAPPAYVAADLLAQAEHTGEESLILVGIGSDYDFRAVQAEITRQLADAPRADLIRRSLATGALFIRADTPADAVELANMKAPEHLQIMARNAARLIDQIDNVGAAFLGPYTPTALGDYAAGPNHVLPTGSTARFFSPLGVDAFLKASNVITATRPAARALAPTVEALASAEGLHAHAASARLRRS